MAKRKTFAVPVSSNAAALNAEIEKDVPMEKPQPLVPAYCSTCLGETRHRLIGRCSKAVDGDDGWYERTIYELVQCLGCENASLRRTYHDAAEPADLIEYFPPAASRRLPEWMAPRNWPPAAVPWPQIVGVLREVYAATFSGNNRVALMGTRAVIDLALTEQLGDIGGLNQKLREAKKRGWIGNIDYDIFRTVIDAGDAASHRAYNPDAKQLNLIVDTVEHLVELLYVLQPAAKEIAAGTPSRPPKQSKQ
ncbi:MAG: hypothetical protein HKL96_01780 [Phycisphaerales bacterium]|nr:hypothetical protein [Phycisphaerales bacterium]